MREAIKEMVAFNVLPATLWALRWSDAGFPTIVNTEILRAEAAFWTQGEQKMEHLLSENSAQTPVEAGDGHFPVQSQIWMLLTSHTLRHATVPSTGMKTSRRWVSVSQQVPHVVRSDWENEARWLAAHRSHRPGHTAEISFDTKGLRH